VPKHVSPLVGFNNNVKHKGRIFHVQTEDSGVSRPRIVTHLFADGGRIIRSTKTDYSEHVGRKDMVAVVRRLMKEQHKAMFISLRDGQFDETIAQICGEVAAEPEEAPVPVEEPPAQRRSQAPPKPRRSVPPSKRPGRPPTIPDMPAPAVDTSAAKDLPVARRPAPTLNEFTLADIAAPPAGPVAPTVRTEGESRRPPVKGTPILGTPAVQAPGGSGHRYAAPRPAAIFSEPPPTEGGSIFGGSSISEQSLDEVILSYLAEDLDGPAPDK
jgi:hypothetical protein